MTKKEATEFNSVIPELTAKQRATLLASVKPSREECAKHPRTRKGCEYYDYTSAMQSVGGNAVLRIFQACYTIRQGKVDETDISELGRAIISRDGKVHIFAKHLRPFSYYIRREFSWDSEFGYVSNGRYSQQNRRFMLADNSCAICLFSAPRWLRQRGYTKGLCTYAVRDLFTPRGEAIAKWGYGHMLNVWWRQDEAARANICTALRICRRNGYAISDYRDYCDYIRELVVLGRDIHNAHYVCPADLAAAHQQTTRLVERKREEERRKTERREAISQEAAYAQRMAAWLGICLEADDLIIKPLQSVQAFYDEGRAMHHCVAGYYNFEDTLILSARDAEGNRLATIEVRISEGRIVQTRDRCNAVPPRKDEIESLIRANMSYIQHPTKAKAA